MKERGGGRERKSDETHNLRNYYYIVDSLIILGKHSSHFQEYTNIH